MNHLFPTAVKALQNDARGAVKEVVLLGTRRYRHDQQETIYLF